MKQEITKQSERTYTSNIFRALRVFDRLVAAFLKKRYPFDHSIAPQARDNMPVNLEFGTKEHALFLWASCYYMRGGIDSIVAFQQLTLIYERKPYLFQPEWFAEQFKDEPYLQPGMKYSKDLKRQLAEPVRTEFGTKFLVCDVLG